MLTLNIYNRLTRYFTHPVFICSQSTVETREPFVKSVQMKVRLLRYQLGIPQDQDRLSELLFRG